MCTNPVVAGDAIQRSVYDGWMAGVDISGPLWIVSGRPQDRFEMTAVTPILGAVIHGLSPECPQRSSRRHAQASTELSPECGRVQNA